MPVYPRDTPHFKLEQTGTARPYSARGSSSSKKLNPRNKDEHAAALRAAIQAALADADQLRGQLNPEAKTGRDGFYLEIEVPYERRHSLDALSNRPKGIELVSVRPSPDDGPLIAGVFVPETAKEFYAERLTAYEQPSGNKPPKNQRLIEAIDDIRIGRVATVFTDNEDRFPTEDTPVWWEVWLRKGTLEHFTKTAEKLELLLQKGSVVSFRERDVVLVKASPSQLGNAFDHTDAVAEVRIASETPSAFMEMDGTQQYEWASELLDRLTYSGSDAPVVCLLDTGVNNQHPLIAPALPSGDLHTYNPAWGKHDCRRHGTSMAGLALLGDLTPLLLSNEPVVIQHALESVKMFPPVSATPHDPDLYGAVTEEVVARVEINAANRPRTFALSITGAEHTTGRPSQWSAKIDELAFGPEHPRLFVLAAGNIRVACFATNYPSLNDTSAAEDPSQSWNALTVGAFTTKTVISDPIVSNTHVPIAASGDLSPVSRTSLLWSGTWPIKPDVVCEGGNYGAPPNGEGDPLDDLQLLTTFALPQNRPFTTFGDTCSAVADAARICACILAHDPTLWPETVRGLIVHSAEWTDAMQSHVADKAVKGQWRTVLRRYGYGVPDLARALYSSQNDVSIIVEDSLQPFHKPKKNSKGNPNSSVVMNEMNVHGLPWPKEEFLQLQDAQARCKVTLSYFTEPNPGERGWTRRHRYASHGLRFAFKLRDESEEEFLARISAAIALDENEAEHSNSGNDTEWLLGMRQRNVGSVHSDIWTGTAADLATRDAIAVYPVGGWWKEKPYLERFESKARYSLIVSVSVPSAEIDIRNLIATEVGVPIETVVGAGTDE